MFRRSLPSSARLAAAALVLAAAALAAPSARPVPAHAATVAWQPEQPTFGVDLRRDLPITMRDGVVLRANVGIPVPGGGTAWTPGEGRYPTLIVQTPYRKDGGLFTVDTWFVQRGYAVVVVDVRGTGSSEGQWSSFSPDEQEDGPAVVRWAAHQPWADGSAGLMGASYSAINQLLTMEQPDAPGEVKAIFPAAPMSDAYRDVTFHGSDFDDAFLAPWLGLVTALGLPPADQATDGNPSDTADSLTVLEDHLVGATQFQVPQTVGVSTGDATAYDGPFYQVRSPLWRIKSVHVPTTIVGGEFDIFQRAEPLLYEQLDVPAKRLLIGPWVHLQAAGGTSGNASGLPGTPDLHMLELQWYDQYVKGESTGVDALPRVVQYDLTGTAPSGFVVSGSYPLPTTAPQRWYLDGTASGSAPTSFHDGGLDTAAPPAAGGDLLPFTLGTGCTRTTFQWGDATAEPDANLPCETDERADEVTQLTYSSAPLAAPVTVDGPLTAHLSVAMPAGGDTIVSVRLVDVAPDGTATQLTAGWLRLSQRATLDEPLVTQHLGGALVRPFHPFTQPSQETPPVTATGYDVEVFPTIATFATGHRIRLDVGTGDMPHMLPSIKSMGDLGAAIEVDHGGPTQSYADLPVVADPPGVVSTTLPGTSMPAGAGGGANAAAASGGGDPQAGAVAGGLPLTAGAPPAPGAAVALTAAALLAAVASGTRRRRRRG